MPFKQIRVVKTDRITGSSLSSSQYVGALNVIHLADPQTYLIDGSKTNNNGDALGDDQWSFAFPTSGTYIYYSGATKLTSTATTQIEMIAVDKANQFGSVFVSKNRPADYDNIADAIDALPTGGTIILDDIVKGEEGYESPGTITTDNITIIGTSIPLIDFENEVVGNDCSLIEGTVTVQADNFVMDKVFIKAGSGVASAGQDCLVVNLSGSRNGFISNCAFLGYERESLFHCLLIERMQNVIIKNPQTCRNVWGVALKESFIQLDGLHSKNNNYGGLIIKADSTKTVQNVIATNLLCESTPDGDGDNHGALYIQNYQASSFLKNIQVTNFRLVNQYLYISNVNTSTVTGLENINVSDGIIESDGASGTYNVFFNSQPCSGLIKLSNIIGFGAGSYGIRDENRIYSNVILNNCDFDKPIDCNYNISNRSFGGQYKKTGVEHNVTTQLFSYTYDSPSFAQLDVSIGFQSASVIASGKYSVANGFSTGNSSKIHLQGYGITDMLLSVSINTGTKVVTVSILQTNSSSETGTVYYSIIPRIVGGQTVITPL